MLSLGEMRHAEYAGEHEPGGTNDSAAVASARGKLRAGVLTRAEFGAVRAAEATREWRKVFDEKYGEYFYLNSRTGATSWTRPTGRHATVGKWSEVFDQTFDTCFYVNLETKETSWKRPRA